MLGVPLWVLEWGGHRGNECLRPGASERRPAEVAVSVMCY